MVDYPLLMTDHSSYYYSLSLFGRVVFSIDFQKDGLIYFRRNDVFFRSVYGVHLAEVSIN